MEAHAFAASLLRASARGFAGLAATRMADGAPALVGAAGFDAWQEHLRHQVLSLAAAVADEAPERFSARAGWLRNAYAARALPADALEAALDSLAATLQESLPADAWAPLPEYFRRARAELERGGGGGPVEPDARPAPTTAAAPAADVAAAPSRAQRYVEALTAGDEEAAVALVRAALDARSLDVPALIATVLLPAQREFGRRWHCGQLGVGEEHFATQVSRRVLALALERSPPAPQRGRSVVLAAAAGDAHDLGLACVAAHFTLDGWRTLFLGADTPAADLTGFVERYQPDLVVLGATLDEHRGPVAEAIRALRASRPSLRVLVGGAAFDGREELWRRSGADGYAPDPAAAVVRGAELLRG